MPLPRSSRLIGSGTKVAVKVPCAVGEILPVKVRWPNDVLMKSLE